MPRILLLFNETGPALCLQQVPAINMAGACRAGSNLDIDAAVLYHGRIGFYRNHAGWRHDLAGADVELTIVEVAFHHVVFDIALRQRAWPVGAIVIRDVELAADVEDRQHQPAGLDFQGGADGDVVGVTELDTSGHFGGVLLTRMTDRAGGPVGLIKNVARWKAGGGVQAGRVPEAA